MCPQKDLSDEFLGRRNMAELISIIVPVYNCEKYIEKALNSLKEQTYQDIEVLVIDDGSTDKSLEIAERFASSDQRFKVIHQCNAGVSNARNKGLSLATGSIIGFVDADDVCDPRQFEKMYNSLLENQAQAAICSLLFELAHRTIFQGDKTSSSICMDKQTAIIELYKGNIYSGHVHNKIFRRELCENILFDEDISIGEDTLFCLKALSKASKVVYINEGLYHYQIRSNSAYQQKNIDKMYTSHIAYRRMNSLIERLGLNEIGKKTFLIAYMSNICNLLLIFKEQNQIKDRRYDELRKLLKTLYLDIFKRLTIRQKIALGMKVYCFNICFVKHKIKTTIIKIVRGRS